MSLVTTKDAVQRRHSFSFLQSSLSSFWAESRSWRHRRNWTGRPRGEDPNRQTVSSRQLIGNWRGNNADISRSEVTIAVLTTHVEIFRPNNQNNLLLHKILELCIFIDRTIWARKNLVFFRFFQDVPSDNKNVENHPNNSVKYTIHLF